MRTLVTLTIAALVAMPALAAPCRDAKGRFAKCPPTAAQPVTKDAKGHCHGPSGKFVTCPK